MHIKNNSLILDKNIKLHKFRGSEYIQDFIENRFKGTEVIVYFDPDVDGLMAGYFACKALALRGIKFTWYINSLREHGFLLPEKSVKGRNIFCVDFVIPEEQLKRLVDLGCNVLSIDHHDNGEDFIEYESNGKKGIIINNQFACEDDSSRYLSGAGVVFESLIPYFGDEFNTRENRAVVGITLLTDIRDIENINARLYLQELYNHPYKGYIKYLIECTMGEVDYGFGVPRMDRNYVDYTFSPIINSCLRFNRQNDVVQFILGCGYIDRGYHKRQKELLSELMEVSKVVSFEHLNIVIIDKDHFKGTENEEYLTCFVGLLASQYLDGKRSSIAYLVSGSEVGRASFRGRVNGLDYLSILKERINGIGHGSAFGIKVLKPSKELFLWADNVCAELENYEDFSVDYIETRNLSMILNNKGYSLGVENIYCLSQHRRYIKYTGANVKVRRSGAKYKEYNIDGVSVMCFDNNLDPQKDLIMPIIERGVLNFYLNKAYE